MNSQVSSPIAPPEPHAPPAGPVPRPAAPADAAAIHALIARNLEAGHLLPRTLADVARHVCRFVVVASGDGEPLACAELAPLSAGVAEVRSLVVHESARNLGLGRIIVRELRRRARAGRFRTLCAFTHDPRFFTRLGFSIVPHFWLPEKVAADCWNCPLFQKCGQYAMIDSCLGRAGLPAPGRERFS